MPVWIASESLPGADRAVFIDFRLGTLLLHKFPKEAQIIYSNRKKILTTQAFKERSMKLKHGLITLLLVTLGSIGTSEAAARSGKIVGYQYVTFADGDAALEDNAIHYIPCAPKNNCLQIQEAMRSELTQAQSEMRQARLSLERPAEAWNVFTQLDQQLLPMLTRQAGYKTVKTGKKGVYRVNCPTKNCLIYSFGVVRDRYGYWLTISPGRKRLDLGPGKGIAEDKPRSL